MVLYVLLPVTNALLDFLSWWASRRLLAGLIRRDRPDLWRALWHVAFDMLLAVGFLAALAGLLPLALEGLNALAEGVVIDWRAAVAEAQRAPLTAGFLVTFMLFTTLIPTLLHALAMTFLFVLGTPLQPGFYRRWLDETLLPEEKIKRALLPTCFVLSGMLSLLVVYAIGALAYALLSVIFGPFGLALADLAYDAGDWVATLAGNLVPPR